MIQPNGPRSWEPRQARSTSLRTNSRRAEWLALAILLLAALAIRVYRLDSFPDTVLADEADNAQSAVRILYGQPPTNGFFGLDWTQQPALSAYKQASFFAAVGFSILALRLPSAFISLLALVPFFVLLRRQFSATAALLATILLATSVWYLNFSRSGWNIIDICFYLLMAMLCLLRALDALKSDGDSRGSLWIQFAAAGLFCALGLYGYTAGRAISIAVAAFFPLALLYNRRHWRTLLVGYALLFAVAGLVFAPEGMYAARNWELFNGRTHVVFLMNRPEYQADPVGTLVHQLDQNLRGPWDGAVNNTPQYSPVGEPQLDRITGLLVLVGMALTVVSGQLRARPETWLWWLMLLVGWTLTQLITTNTPNGARGIGYLPALIYFAGATLDATARGLTYLGARLFPEARRASLAKPLGVAAFSLVVLIMGYANVTHYFDWQNQPQTRSARYLYITSREFSEWSATIVSLAKNNGGIVNVGQWRQVHPVQNIAEPYGIPVRGP